MHNFKELKIWQNARVLSKEIHLLVKKLPADERFELGSQLRRSVVSIPSNIAEGSGRGSNKDFRRFLSIALSSAFELETQLILAYDLEYFSEEEFQKVSDKIQELQKMIYGFRKSLSTINKSVKLFMSLLTL